MTRSPRLTQDIEDTIIEALRIGNTRKVAANLAGVREETLKIWVNQLPTFRTKVEMAEAQMQDELVRALFHAATKRSWQAAITMLSRRDPVAWGEIQRFEVYQKIEELQSLQNELAQSGIKVTMQQLIADLEEQRISDKKSKRKTPTLRALPPPASAASD